MPTRLLRLLCAASATAAVSAALITIAPQATGVAPGFGFGTATFTTSSPPTTLKSRVAVGDVLVRNDTDLAGEPSIGVNWLTGNALYQADASTYKITFNNQTSPPTITWADATSPYSVANIDPILATDPRTGITLAGGDDGACGGMSRTMTDGGVWNAVVPCSGTEDHPTVAIGPYAGIPTGWNGQGAAYYCQHLDAVVCSRSMDGGSTWSPGTPTLGCFGGTGHAKIAPDGVVYVPNINCADNDGNLVVGADFSTDDGITWSSYGIPGADEPDRGFDPSVAIGTDKTVFESWARAGDYHPVVTWSKNRGATWAPQVDLATTVNPPLRASTFQAAVAGDAGRAAVAYLGTWAGTDGLTPFDSGYHGVWYLFVSYTYDGGATWSTVQASTEPVQRGQIDDGGTAAGGQRNLLDFMDAQLTKDGRVVVAYADGCLTTCNSPSGTEAMSTHAYASVAYQTTGQGLFAAYDITPVTVPGAPVLSATGGNGSVSLSWTAPDDGGSVITGYRVYRDGTLVGSPAGTSYVDSGVSAGTTYSYRVAAVNELGQGSLSNAVSATPTSVPGAPTLSASGGNQRNVLTWTAPYDGGTPITGYQVLRGSAAGAETAYATVGNVTTFTDTAVTPGVTYWYRVVAVNANGAGPASSSAAATATTVPSAPVLTAAAGKGQVTLSWTAPANGGQPITGYAIYRGTAAGGETLYQTISSGTVYVDPGVSGGTTYYYTVAAINANGTGAPSNEASATPKGR